MVMIDSGGAEDAAGLSKISLKEAHSIVAGSAALLLFGGL
jgi:hypothetical protein